MYIIIIKYSILLAVVAVCTFVITSATVVLFYTALVLCCKRKQAISSGKFNVNISIIIISSDLYLDHHHEQNTSTTNPIYEEIENAISNQQDEKAIALTQCSAYDFVNISMET